MSRHFWHRTLIDPVDKTLILDQVTLNDQGTYICEGENSVGSARALAMVSVNCKYNGDHPFWAFCVWLAI